MSSPEPTESWCSWSDLPDVVLTKIYSELNVFDRRSASLVCRNWSKGFNAPSLWRHVAVFFLGVPSRMHNFEVDGNRKIPALHDRSALKFSTRHGKHLKALVLAFHPMNRCRGASVQGKIEKFLNNLTEAGCSLKELAIMGYSDPNICYPRDKENIIRASVDFLLYQTELEFVDFRSFEEDTRLLETVVATSGPTLISLNATLFFEPGSGSRLQDSYYEILCQVSNLETIKLSFVSVDQIALKILVNNCPNLKIIHINAHCTEVFPDPPVNCLDWKKACKVRPKLQVRMDATLPRLLSNLPALLPRYTPLANLELKFTWGTIDEENWDLQSVFQYIASTFSGSLEMFTFKDSVNKDVDEDLNQSIRNLVSSCTKLKYLDLRAEVSVYTIEQIFRYQKDKQIDIEKLKIQSSNFNTDDFHQLEKLLYSNSDVLKMREWEFTSPKHLK